MPTIFSRYCCFLLIYALLGSCTSAMDRFNRIDLLALDQVEAFLADPRNHESPAAMAAAAEAHDEILWAKVEKSEAGWTAFLKVAKSPKYQNLAKAHIEDSQAWSKVDYSSVAEIKDFLSKAKTSPFVAAAQARLGELAYAEENRRSVFYEAGDSLDLDEAESLHLLSILYFNDADNPNIRNRLKVDRFALEKLGNREKAIAKVQSRRCRLTLTNNYNGTTTHGVLSAKRTEMGDSAKYFFRSEIYDFGSQAFKANLALELKKHEEYAVFLWLAGNMKVPVSTAQTISRDAATLELLFRITGSFINSEKICIEPTLFGCNRTGDIPVKFLRGEVERVRVKDSAGADIFRNY